MAYRLLEEGQQVEFEVRKTKGLRPPAVRPV